jgi:phenylalanyl-tRNA synthetase beta chain
MKPGEIRYVPLGHTDKMNADEILEEHKKGQQYGHLIKGQERYPVFIDAAGKVMALIPIVNSAETGRVDETTEDLFIEVTGNDMGACKAALNILVCTFADMGGELHEVGMEYGKDRFQSPDLEPKTMAVDVKAVNRMLGIELSEAEMGGLLGRMGYRYKKGMVFVPPYRADVMGLVDIVEDIAIAYGYNNFKPTIPDFFSPGEVVKTYDGLDEVMRGMGFVETKTFILTNKERLGITGAPQDVVEIANPATADYTVVRSNLISDMLDTFRINKMKGLPQRFYEIGIVQTGKKTRKKLVFGVMDKKIEFSDARGYLQTLASEKGREFSLEKKASKVFEPGLSCAIASNGKDIGVFGKVGRGVLDKFGLGFDVYICELEL